MGPGRKICIVPHGTKTTKAVVEGFNRLRLMQSNDYGIKIVSSIKYHAGFKIQSVG